MNLATHTHARARARTERELSLIHISLGAYEGLLDSNLLNPAMYDVREGITTPILHNHHIDYDDTT